MAEDRVSFLLSEAQFKKQYGLREKQNFWFCSVIELEIPRRSFPSVFVKN